MKIKSYIKKAIKRPTPGILFKTLAIITIANLIHSYT